jgi:anthranilate phosphoribosyltransferase
MKSVAAVRKKLGKRTIFNLLGPLCNPARPNCMLIGVFKDDFLPKYMGAIQHLDIPDVMVVSSRDGLDEVSTSDKTLCYHKKGTSLKVFDFDPKDLGIYGSKDAIKGDEAMTNAQVMREVFQGKNHNAITDVVALNAAFAFSVAEVETDLKKAFLLAKETIKSGRAYEKLRELTA